MIDPVSSNIPNFQKRWMMILTSITLVESVQIICTLDKNKSEGLGLFISYFKLLDSGKKV